MGNRRIGRRRLFSLEKKGQESANRPGPGISGAVVSSKVSRDGSQITTEIVIDLGAASLLTTLKSKNTDTDVIGVDGGGAAYLTQLTTAVNGIVTDAEIICTEAPVGGEVDIDVLRNASGTLAYDAGGGSDKLIDSGADYVIGLTKTGTLDNNAANNQYLYLAVGTNTSPTAGAYSAGKFVLRIIGYAVEADH